MPMIYVRPNLARRVWLMSLALVLLYAAIIIAIAVAIARPACASELLLPGISKHTSYKGQKLDHLNEWNYGLGYEGDKGYFALAFKDSLHNPSLVLGRNFRATWPILGDSGLHVSATLSAGLMFRKNVGNYMPFPVALPFLGIGYKDWTAEVTYIPATRFTEQGAAFLMLRKSL